MTIALSLAVGILLIHNAYLHLKFRRMHRDMAIVEQIVSPFVELIENHKKKMESQGIKPGQSILHG